MSNDNGLIDEFEKLQRLREDIDKKIEEIREKIINLSKEKNIDILFGMNKKCSIKSYEKVVYPENKTFLIEIIRSKGLYDRFSSLNYSKLSPAIIKGEVGYDIISLVRKEKAFRISLKDLI